MPVCEVCTASVWVPCPTHRIKEQGLRADVLGEAAVKDVHGKLLVCVATLPVEVGGVGDVRTREVNQGVGEAEHALPLWDGRKRRGRVGFVAGHKAGAGLGSRHRLHEQQF